MDYENLSTVRNSTMGVSKILGYQDTLGLDRILRALCYEFSDDSDLKVFMPVTARVEHRHWTFN